MIDPSLSREHFAALFLELIYKCYPDKTNRDEALKKADYRFFGYNIKEEGEQKIELISKSVRGILLKKFGKKIGGKALRDYVEQYNFGSKTILLTQPRLKKYFDILEINSISELDELRIKYEREYNTLSHDFPPEFLKESSKSRIERSIVLAENAEPITYLDNMFEIGRNKWWFYFYEYEGSTEKNQKIIRLVLNFQERDGSYNTKLINTNDAYVTFQGKVVSNSERLLICELEGDGKKFYFMLSIEPTGKKDIYMGMYLKHNANTQLISCSAIVHRIPNNYEYPRAEVFPLNQQNESVPSAIQDFFQKKEFVYKRTKRLYDIKFLKTWLDNKKEERGEKIEFDLFLAAPIKAFEKKLEQSNRLSDNLIAEMKKNLVPNNRVLTDLNTHSLEKKIKEIVSHELIGIGNEEAGLSKDKFLKEIQELVEDLEGKFGIKIYHAFSREREKEKSNFHRYPKQLLDEELSSLQKSKAYMLICSKKNLWSSCWITLGWAMMMPREMPIFVFYANEIDELPYILWRADTYKLQDIEMLKFVSEFDTIDKIPEILKGNALWKNNVANPSDK